MTCYVLTACSQALASHSGAALWRQLWADVAQALNLLWSQQGPTHGTSSHSIGLCSHDDAQSLAESRLVLAWSNCTSVLICLVGNSQAMIGHGVLQQIGQGLCDAR